MDKAAGQKGAARVLYPSTTPFDQRMLDVGNGHQVYVEQCGNPQGIPVVVLHGGPGGGCSPAMRRYINPKEYRIILFDQRGCGRSLPGARVEHNTTWDLVADIEQIRSTLGIDRWVVFGGSWGATLALLYAQKHPDAVAYMVLRGVFLMMQSELDWFYGGGAGGFWPDLWARFVDPIPEDERGDMVAAYNKRLFSGDRKAEVRFAQIWTQWENALASIGSDGAVGVAPPEYARAFARLENHYFTHKGWLREDRQILDDIPLISHVPATVVQGRYDMICPPRSAWQLVENWPRAELKMVGRAGHALSEPGIAVELVKTTDALVRQAGILRL